MSGWIAEVLNDNETGLAQRFPGSTVEGFKAVGLAQDHLFAVVVEEAFAVEFAKQAGDCFAGDAGQAAKLFMGERHGEDEGLAGFGGFDLAEASPI